MQAFIDERDGQYAFFRQFGIDPNIALHDNTDGVWNGNLLEFKLSINDPNKVLFQSIKYLSRMRTRGRNVPANIVLVSLNSQEAYIYSSEDYRSEIERVYIGAASNSNSGFITHSDMRKIDYDNANGIYELMHVLQENSFMPINIDEDCIVGWAERYYSEVPNAKKGDFIGDGSGVINVLGEIRNPVHFAGLILPYEKETNERFKYLMDKLNDHIQKKDLGAYYTPTPYCLLAAELVRKAIDDVPAGNDYVIIDRCAGSGNLESVLTDEELSHCIVSTYEYYEYKVLVERIGDRVRHICPPPWKDI